LLDPTSRQKILQRNQIHADEFPGGADARRKSSLMELKQLWLMSRCELEPSRRFARTPVLRTGHGHIEIESRIIRE
jgi:hypothetical protein